ncbi:hypothetical protein C4D60_Mb07t07590 [Musa balbisiana]|uniref:Uncharacterized protein n=1 Tax=Musa balbisiana TaxID=52838 RepID=A0A4S8JDN0_MUSBA|nr:hypothetical protein C4D60_Mb07t07590 [Musa balbisiana]
MSGGFYRTKIGILQQIGGRQAQEEHCIYMEEMMVNKAFANVMDENIITADDGVTIEKVNENRPDQMTNYEHQQDSDTNALPPIAPK